MFNPCKADADRLTSAPEEEDTEELELLQDVASIQPAMMDLWFPEFAQEEGGIGRCRTGSTLPLGAPVHGGCSHGMGNGGSDAIQGIFTGALNREACQLSPPFVPGPPFRHGDCVWLEWQGWTYAPSDAPGAAGDMELWRGQYDGLYGQRKRPGTFLPSVYLQGYADGAEGRRRGLSVPAPRGVGARALRASPGRERGCYTKMTHKGLWVCCQGTCRLAVRLKR